MKIKTTKLNKREKSFQDAYLRSTDNSLFDAYDNVSKAKWKAWEHCEAVCKEHDGWDLKVISHNSFQFTAGFEFENPSTGAVSLYIITKSDEFAFEEWFEQGDVK